MTTQVHYEWLGIPAAEQPPDHYRLLGVVRFESNVDVIRESARLRIEEIRQFPYDAQAEDPRPLMNRVLAARECLLNPETRYSYETRLRAELALSSLSPPSADPAASPVPAPLDADRAAVHPVSILDRRAYAKVKHSQPQSTRAVAPIPVTPPGPAAAAGHPATSYRFWWRATTVLLLLAAGIGIGRLINFGPRTTDFQETSQAQDVASTPPADAPAIGDDELKVNDSQEKAAGAPQGQQPVDEAVVAQANDGNQNHAVPGDGAPAAAAIAQDIPGAAAPERNAAEVPKLIAVAPAAPAAAEQAAVAELDPANGQNDAGAEIPGGPVSVVRVLPPPPSFRSDEARTAYLNELSALLAQGADTRRGSLDDAARHYEAARHIVAGDQRLEYAYGLVLLRFLRYDESAAQFEAAVAADDAYLPAHQAAAWVKLLRREYEPAQKALVRLASAIETHAAEYPGFAARDASAFWVGRALGFFEGPGSSLRGAEALVESLRESVVPTLSEPWQQAFAQGRASVAEVEHELLQAVDNAELHAKARQQVLAADKQQELTAQQQANVKEFESLQMTAEKWQEWIKEQTEELDRQIQERAESYTSELDRAQSMSTEIANLQTHIMTFENMMRVPGVSSIRALQEINVRRTRILELQAQLDGVNRRAEAIRREADAFLARRAAAVDRYQRATGKILKDGGELQKVEQRLQRQLTGLEKDEGGTAPQVATLRRKAASIRTYLEPDYDAERRRILTSYDIDAGQPARESSEPASPRPL